MLKAIYDYAITRELALPPGYAQKQIKYYINVSSDDGYIGLIPGGDSPVLCPDIGSLANGKDKSNVLAEKRSVLLDAEQSVKFLFFKQALEDGASYEPDLLACKAVLDDPVIFEKIRQDADQLKIKGMDRLSFMVEGRIVVQSRKVQDWWQTYRLQFQKSSEDKSQTLCLITGEPTIPVATVPPVTGLSVVGGHSKGDALICFDKSAFQSYDLKQSANAPVSEEAIFSVKAGLDHLLKHAPVLTGMKFVHWYDCPIPEEDDILLQSFGILAIDDDEEEEEEEYTPIHETSVDIAAEEAKATALVDSIHSGLTSPPLASRYTILLLSGVNGRVMVRRYEHGSYEELSEKLALWERDLQLCKANGTQLLLPKKLVARFTRLLSYHKNDRKIFDRLSSELSGLTHTILTAILSGTPLPDSVAVRALSYIRSRMLDNEDEQTSMPIPDSLACQWLKVWLVRKHRMEQKEEFLMEYYNQSHPEVAYHCGALMCVYGNIQHLAMPNANASVVQRYFASAMQTPALVLGTLSRQSAHHQEKITSSGWRAYYEELLCKVHTAAGSSLPSTLTLEEQSLFALGYYQMQAEINKKVNEKRAEKNASQNNEV